MKRVVYTNSDGFKEVRIVPDNTTANRYQMGVKAGPPDLEELDLSKDDRRKLNNALVEAGFIELEDTNLRRAELLRLIEKTLKVSVLEAKYLRLNILGVFQRQVLGISPGVEITYK